MSLKLRSGRKENAFVPKQSKRTKKESNYLVTQMELLKAGVQIEENSYLYKKSIHGIHTDRSSRKICVSVTAKPFLCTRKNLSIMNYLIMYISVFQVVVCELLMAIR